MTPSEIRRIAETFAAAGRRNIPVPISEWREMQFAMATKSIGKVSETAISKGKVAPVVKRSASQKAASVKKAARVVKGLKANRSKSRKG